jgi:hypothetical protein
MPEVEFIKVFKGKPTEQAKKLANGIDIIWAESFPHTEKDLTIVVGLMWEKGFYGEFSLRLPGAGEQEVKFGTLKPDTKTVYPLLEYVIAEISFDDIGEFRIELLLDGILFHSRTLPIKKR